jgi:hypothetical protein
MLVIAEVVQSGRSTGGPHPCEHFRAPRVEGRSRGVDLDHGRRGCDGSQSQGHPEHPRTASFARRSAPRKLHAAERFLEFVHEHGDPLLQKLTRAPLDDEPVTEEEEAGVREAWEDYRAGRVTTLDELERESDR